jgi:transcriptional regulator with XRE-family HTH domain
LQKLFVKRLDSNAVKKARVELSRIICTRAGLAGMIFAAYSCVIVSPIQGRVLSIPVCFIHSKSIGMTNKKRCPGTVSFARFKLGISQQQLADALGVSRSMVAMFETGRRRLPRNVAATYLELCKRAAAINPGEEIIVRRGRKPILSQRTVTNCESYRPAKNEISSSYGLSSKMQLVGQRVVAQFKIKAIEERAKQISEALAFADAMPKVHTAVQEVLPPGKQKDTHELRSMAMQSRQLRLKQALKHVPVEMLTAQFKLGLVEAGMEGLEVFTGSMDKTADAVLMGSREFEEAA